MKLSIPERVMLQSLYHATEAEIISLGYETGFLFDFEAARAQIEAAGKEMMPFFWHSYFQPNEHNGYCLVVKEDGVGKAYICTRLLDCGGLNFHEFYTSILKAIYSHDPRAELDPDWICEPMLNIRGVVAYSGDAVVPKTVRSPARSSKILGLASKLSLYFTILTWPDLDWVVGTVSERHAQRGLPWYYGGTSVYPMAEKWRTLPEGRDANYSFVASSRADVLYGARAAIHRTASPKQTGCTPESEVQSSRSETGE